jgi:hypothetical protein
MTTTLKEADLEIPPVPPTESERATVREIKKRLKVYQEKEEQLQLMEIELEGLRFMLGEKLSGMKCLLTLYGRGDQWAAFLRKCRMPHAFGEKCILEHDEGSFGISTRHC